MKIKIPLFLFILAGTSVQAQSYLIGFSGSGASTQIDLIKVENLTRCTDTTLVGGDTLQLTWTAGIDNPYQAPIHELTVFPNPSSESFMAEFNASCPGNYRIGVYNLTGSLIVQKCCYLQSGVHTFRLSGLACGMYSLCVGLDHVFLSARIIQLQNTPGPAEIKLFPLSAIPDKSLILSGDEPAGIKKIRGFVQMPFNPGDTLKFMAKSGKFRTVVVLAPTQNQVVNFEFMDCTDSDSNHYAAVQIGSQWWMAESLRTGKYRNGDSIPNVTDSTDWQNLFSGAYCDYNNLPANSLIIGKLYNYYCVSDPRQVCPLGWHVPSDSTWTLLADSLGGDSIAGGKLKEKCLTTWPSPNTGATNETGFTALYAGSRDDNGTFNPGDISLWWSSTEYLSDYSWAWSVSFDHMSLERSADKKGDGYSVRCIKD